MVYAQISNVADENDPPVYQIVNTIVLDDEELIPLFAEGYDYFVRVDDRDPEPGISCEYFPDTDTFGPMPRPN